jgi:hypothetical protein
LVGPRRSARFRKGLALLAMLGALVMATNRTVAAAMVVRLSTQPPQPKVGESALLQVRTFAPVVVPGSPDWRLQPIEVPPDYAFNVEAVDPSGTVSPVPISQSTDPYVWSGQLTFARAGTWEIRITNFGPNYNPQAGGLLKVHVSSGIGPPIAGLRLAGLGGAIAISVLLLTGWRRRWWVRRRWWPERTKRKS